MKPWMKRMVFYAGTLLVVIIMCQDFFKQAFLAVLGDDVGDSLFSFVRTNVEAPISITFIALYLDVVLLRRTDDERVGTADR